MTTTFRAAILDFDGLVLETEGPCFESWREMFRASGADYALHEYQQVVGSAGSARTLYEVRCGRPEDWAPIEARRRELEARLHAALAPQPGVESLIAQARALGLAVGIASSSPRAWVERHLGAHGLRDRFDVLVCREDAPRAKPDPDLYLEAARRLGATPATSVAFEDSYNGTLAARRAAIRCVAVPTLVTATMDFSAADLVVPSLEGFDLAAALAAFERR